MDAQSWLNSLPNNPGPARDQAVLDAISGGIVVCNWSPITSTIAGHTAIFQVCEDAAYIELPDSSRFRFQVSATLAQKCADLLSASFITSKISDLAYKQAQVVVGVSTLSPDPDMVTTDKSKKWNTAVENKRASRTGLFRDCGKAWILSNRLSTPVSAVNYGFYDKSAPYVSQGGLKMWQTVGTRHDRSHTDYSQTLILMSSSCEVDGQSVNVIDVMKDPKLSSLLSYEGVLRFTRQPGV
jgi:hypothetical protein